MLIKCLKYETKAFAKVVLPFIVLFALSSTVLSISANLGDPLSSESFISLLISLLFLPAFFVSIIVIPLLTCFFAVKRYKDIMFSNEAYLMRSLPVSGKTLVSCILINVVFWYIISIVTVIIFTELPFVTLTGSRDLLSSFRSAFNSLMNDKNGFVTESMLSLLRLLFFQLEMMVAVCIASKFNSSFTLTAFLIFILMNFLFTIPQAVFLAVIHKSFRSFDSFDIIIIRGIFTVIMMIYLLIKADKDCDVK